MRADRSEIVAVSTRSLHGPRPTGTAPAAFKTFTSSSVKSPSGPIIKTPLSSLLGLGRTLKTGGAPADAKKASLDCDTIAGRSRISIGAFSDISCTLWHCLTAANTRRCNLSTLFSAIVWHLSVKRGVTLQAPSSVHFSISQSARPPFNVPNAAKTCHWMPCGAIDLAFSNNSTSDPFLSTFCIDPSTKAPAPSNSSTLQIGRAHV